MLDKLNKENLSLIRSYLPEIVIVLLTVAVIRLQVDVYKAQQQTEFIRQDQVKFEREMGSKVLTQLTQNTEAMNQMKNAIQIFLSRK